MGECQLVNVVRIDHSVNNVFQLRNSTTSRAHAGELEGLVSSNWYPSSHSQAYCPGYPPVFERSIQKELETDRYDTHQKDTPATVLESIAAIVKATTIVSTNGQPWPPTIKQPVHCSSRHVP